MPPRKKPGPSKPTNQKPKAKPGLALDDYIIALQKSFSRVANRSRNAEIRAAQTEDATTATKDPNAPDPTRALVVGSVNFRIEVGVRLSDDGEHLLIDPAAPKISFEGKLALDQHLEDKGAAEAEPAAAPPPPPTAKKAARTARKRSPK